MIGKAYSGTFRLLQKGRVINFRGVPVFIEAYDREIYKTFSKPLSFPSAERFMKQVASNRRMLHLAGRVCL